MSIRPVTDEEVADYREQGWLVLPELVSADTVTELGRRSEDLRQVHLDQVHRRLSGEEGETVAQMFRQIESYLDVSREDDAFRGVALHPGLGDSASRLMPGNKPARLFQDVLYVKPARTGEPTCAHQDFPGYALDRAGAVQIWIALVDITPDMGGLQFLTGSHHLGPLGFSGFPLGADLTDQHPWLKEWEVSPALAMKAGDATVHDVCTVHFTGDNRTNFPRTAYACRYLPADARYTGQPHYVTDGLGLSFGGILDHPNFPLVGSLR